MGRRIVFFGNCQAQALSDLYRNNLSSGDDDIQTLLFQTEDADDVNALRSADVIVEQVFRGLNEIVSNNISSDCTRIPFPMAMGAYFWPYASEDHVRNQVYDFAPHLPGGPWVAEEGDSHLNRLIVRGTPTEEAVRSYLALDIATHANLDRLLDLHLGWQRQRDEVAEIDLASIIQHYFRSEPLFSSRGHPELRLFSAVAAAVFPRLGIARAAVEEALAELSHSPLHIHETPMHPRLIEHYRLEWLEPEATFTNAWWGPTSFRQWARRYMEYDWNPELHKGIFLGTQPCGDDPLPYLERGVAHAPDSIHGLRALADAYMSRGRADEAEAAMLRAARLDPWHTQSRLAALLRQRGHRARAEAILRGMIERIPTRAETYFELAELLAADGRATEAVRCLQAVSPLLPRRRPDMQSVLGQRFLRLGEPARAEAAFRAALDIEPAHRDALWGLAEAIHQQGRGDEALGLLRQLAAIESDSPHVHRRMALLLRNVGDVAGAINSLRAVVAAHPEDWAAWEDLAELLARNDATVDETLEIYRRLIQAGTRNFRAASLLGYLLGRLGDLDGSEQSFRLAADIGPQNADAASALINVLAQRGKIGEIMPVYDRFIRSGGTWVVVHNRVGQIMLRSGDRAAAERAFRAALAVDPNHVEAAAGLRQACELNEAANL
jgi:tetratricopeptide (TPR) repeat protein